MGDETKKIDKGPYKGYTLNLDDNTLSGGGDYAGEVLASCSAKDGYLRVAGVKFSAPEMEKLREVLNIGTSRLFLDSQSLIEGTICLKVDDPMQNDFALEQLDDHCPLKDGEKCEAIAETIEKSKPESDIGKELLITCLLGFGILAPLGHMLLQSLVDFFKGRGGKGGGDGDGGTTSGQSDGTKAAPKVAYKGAGAALMSLDGAEFSSEPGAVASPSVTTPSVQTPKVVSGTVVMPNAVAAPKLAPKLVPVVP